MAGRNLWTTRNPDDPKDSGQVDPGPDDCCCSWLKPKSKPEHVLTQDQENSHGISGNMKPSSQQEDYRPQEIKKNGKYTAPNAANVTKNKDQGNLEEENNSSHGGTRPEKTISSTVEQASTRERE